MLENCETCGYPAHESDFGVLTCQAWSSFFGTATTSVVHQESKDLKLLEVQKHSRLNGRKRKNPNSEEHGFQKMPKSLATFLGRPAFLLFSSNPSGIKTILEFDPLIRRVSNVLKAGNYLPFNKKLCSLEKIALSYEGLCKRSDDLQYLQNLRKDHRMMFFEHEFLTTAQWFTHFDEFRELPMEVQLEIVKTCWMVWGRLNNLTMTAENRRKKVLEKDQYFMVSSEAFVDANTTDIDVSWFTEHKKDQIEYFLNCYNNDNYNQVIKELITLCPTNTEINFMLMNLCLQQSEKKLQGKLADITDYLQSVIANQIHKYYLKELKMPNYSGRLSKIMKINNLMKRDTWETAEKMLVAEVFDVFNVDFSHKEMLW